MDDWPLCYADTLGNWWITGGNNVYFALPAPEAKQFLAYLLGDTHER